MKIGLVELLNFFLAQSHHAKNHFWNNGISRFGIVVCFIITHNFYPIYFKFGIVIGMSLASLWVILTFSGVAMETESMVIDVSDL